MRFKVVDLNARRRKLGDKSFDERMRERIQFPPVRTLADMTEEEIEAIEREYGAKVKR